MKKIIVVVGPTAVGKSELAVELARRCNGEIVSADSRQVYRGLNIGTGKIGRREMQGVRHHMLDVVSPRRQFSAEQFRINGQKTIEEIFRRGHVPIICGGAGFYIQALIDGTMFPNVPPNQALRKKLEEKTTAQLFALLKKKDSRRAATSDPDNRRRLIRALEIVAAIGKVPEIEKNKRSDTTVEYNPLFIGLNLPSEQLKKKILARLDARLRQGMIGEARRLRADGLSWKRMNELGLEYRALAEYLRAEKGKNEKKNNKDMKKRREHLRRRLQGEIWHYAKRQLTWFKRDNRIIWFSPTHNKTIVKNVRNFLRP